MKKVIYNRPSFNNGIHGLTQGKTYNVNSCETAGPFNLYKITSDNGKEGRFNSDNFIDAEEDVYTSVSPRVWSAADKGLSNITKEYCNSVGLKDFDPEETRMRNLLKPTILAHECPCGITRVDCAYHQ